MSFAAKDTRNRTVLQVYEDWHMPGSLLSVDLEAPRSHSAAQGGDGGSNDVHVLLGNVPQSRAPFLTRITGILSELDIDSRACVENRVVL